MKKYIAIASIAVLIGTQALTAQQSTSASNADPLAR